MSLEIRAKDMEEIILSKLARGEVESHVSSDIDENAWLFQPHEINIEPTDIQKTEERIDVRVHKHEKKSGVELRQKGYTGGVYAVIEQEMSFTARVSLENLSEPYTLVDIAKSMEILYECDVWASNKNTVNGEKPPF